MHSDGQSLDCSGFGRNGMLGHGDRELRLLPWEVGLRKGEKKNMAVPWYRRKDEDDNRIEREKEETRIKDACEIISQVEDETLIPWDRKKKVWLFGVHEYICN